MVLYRVVSQAEQEDYISDNQFRTGNNTLEAKQFFKSKVAVHEYVSNATMQGYRPPYSFLFTVYLHEYCLEQASYTEMELDGYEAISIHEDYLIDFNRCVNFVEQELI